MRILWLSHNVPYPPKGGVLQRNFHLIREVSRRAELRLVALRQHALCPDEAALEEARSALSGLCASVDFFEIDWERSRSARLALAGSLLLGDAPYDVARFASAELDRFLSQDAPAADLVHVDTIGLVPFRARCTAPAGVLNHHNIESQILARRAQAEPVGLRRPLLGWQARRTAAWERRWAPAFDANLVVSELDRERLEETAPGARTALVPNGVDVAYFDLPANGAADNFEVVMVGAHSWFPNRDAALHFLDDVWPRIVAQEPRARWTVIGRNPDPRVLEASRADPRIQVLGFVDDLRERVAGAAVFLCPFRQGGGTRLKILDGLAMRKAIVSTTLGIEGIPVSDRREVRVADEPEDFAAAVLELFREPGLRVRLGEAGRTLVEERYTWSRIANDLCATYEEALARSGSSA